MMIIGEKKIKQQPTINAYFTKNAKEEETEDDDDVIMNDVDGYSEGRNKQRFTLTFTEYNSLHTMRKELESMKIKCK